MEKYVSLTEKACSGAPLSIYQNPDALYITDELTDKADALFRQAMKAADSEEKRRRIEREYLAVRFLQLTRMEMNVPDRTEQIERFFDDVKRFGITEIMERTSLAVSKHCMTVSRYAKDLTGEYRLYYIMQ